jgi:hypothetical protein
LATLIGVLLHDHGLGIVDVDVVAEKQQGVGVERTDGVPHALVLRDEACAAAEGDVEFGWRAFERESADSGASHFTTAPVRLLTHHRVVVGG